MSTFLQFVVRLLEDGRPAVPAAERITLEERADVESQLAQFEASWRRDLPGDAPRLHPAAAVWGVERLFHACRLLTYRDAGPEIIARHLSATAPGLPDLAEVHYSVDLTARFLPDVVRLARVASTDDPLIVALIDWGAWWPLSSVGLGKFNAERTAAILAHPSLLKIYVDRILLTQDASRVADPAVRAAVQDAVGARRNSAGKLRQALFPEAEQDEPL